MCETSGPCCVETTTVSIRTGRGAVVFDRDLALAVGPQPVDIAFACGRSVRRLRMRWARAIGSGINSGVSIAGVAEHQTLVAGADVFALGRIFVHALGDVGALLVDARPARRRYRRRCPSCRRCSRRRGSRRGRLRGSRSLALVVISPAMTARPVVTSVSQATRLVGVLGEEGVENAVGNLVGQLVGMAHADRFAGEQKFAGCHEEFSLFSWSRSCCGRGDT